MFIFVLLNWFVFFFLIWAHCKTVYVVQKIHKDSPTTQWRQWRYRDDAWLFLGGPLLVFAVMALISSLFLTMDFLSILL